MIICDRTTCERADIIKTINNGFTTIVNVIYSDNSFYLVENKTPTEKVDIEFLQNAFIIVCCFNIEAFYRLNPLNTVHCFSYDFNDFTTTNKKYTITHLNKISSECYYANNDFIKDLILIIPDNVIRADIPFNVHGIITNYPTQVNDRYNFV